VRNIAAAKVCRQVSEGGLLVKLTVIQLIKKFLFMPVVVVISQHLLNVFVQLANKRGLKKMLWNSKCYFRIHKSPLNDKVLCVFHENFIDNCESLSS
jgi:hypothetical protein